MARKSPAKRTTAGLTLKSKAAKRAALARKHCKALIEANKQLVEFERARTAFYRLIFNDVHGKWERIRSAVIKAQATLANSEYRRLNDGAERIKELFDWRSTH
jgi:hypothetical protein